MGTAEKTISYAYGEDANAGWKNILKTYNGENIDYDAIGNPITYRGATLDWDTRELKSYSKNGTEITYKYDADGLRSSKTVNGVTTNYQYVSGKLMYEECNGAEKYYFYDSNGIISGIRYFDANGNMTMIYVVTNALGDVIALYDKNGNAVVEYQYDAWGNIISVVNSTEGSSLDWNELNPFRYRGYYYDSETELYYLQSRYYDAETGRFINADDASVINATPDALTDKNLFAYCDNNPVTRIDKSGDLWFVNALIGVAEQYVSDVVGNFMDGERGWDMLKPKSPPSAYISSAITSLIPGGGLAKAFTRNLISVGCEYVECKINGEDFNLGGAICDVVIGTTIDFSFGKVFGKLDDYVQTKRPPNYSTYAGQQYKKYPGITRSEIVHKLNNVGRMFNFASNMIDSLESVFTNVMGGILDV